MPKTKLFFLIALLAFASPILGQELESITILPGTVRRATTVHGKPSAREPVIGRLTESATVRILSPETRRGFWRIILDRGRQGYVSASDVDVPTSAMRDAAPFAAAARPPCASDLGDCKPHGCATPDEKRGLFNKAKNHRPTGTRSITLSFPDLRSLQRQADRVVEQGTELSQEQRDSLQGFTVTNGRAGEGKLVKLVGFIAQGADPHANTNESVNCRLKTPANNDFHVTIALRPAHTEFQGIVVEMIPHNRPEGWTLAKLRKAKRDGRKVMAVGGLFYDNDHVVNADPTDNLTGEPKRISLWEIHPITQFFVCKRPANACAANNVSQWTKLEDF